MQQEQDPTMADQSLGADVQTPTVAPQSQNAIVQAPIPIPQSDSGDRSRQRQLWIRQLEA
jgi:hypothetical protein